MQDFGNLDNSVSICDPDTFRLHATASPKLRFKTEFQTFTF